MASIAYEALEQQLDLLRFYARPDIEEIMLRAVGKLSKPNDSDMLEARVVARTVRINLEYGEPYYVDGDIQALLMSSLDSLPGTTTLTADLLPTRYGFALLEREVALPLTTMGFEINVRAIGWVSHATGILIHLFGPSRQPGHPTRFDDMFQLAGSPISVKFGQTLDDIVTESVEALREMPQPRERTELPLRLAFALLHFMNQRIASLRHAPAPRAVRRRYESEAKHEAPLIRTIVLRAKEHSPRPADANDGEGSRWTVRSIRRAHWHHYWCKGGSSECLDPGHGDARLELRWIEATVCGPDGAPLARPVDVYAVTR